MNTVLLGRKKTSAKAVAKRRVGRRVVARFRSGTKHGPARKFSIVRKAVPARDRTRETIERIVVSGAKVSIRTGTGKGDVVKIVPRLKGAMNVIAATMKGFSSSSRQELLEAAKNAGYTGAEVRNALDIMTGVNIQEGVYIRPSRKVRRMMQFGKIKVTMKQQTFDPHAVGQRLVESMQAAEGGAWTGQDLDAFFGLTSANLHRRRKEHRIIYWRDARHAFHYPQWQFTQTGALLPGIQEVLELFKSQDEWRVMRYFLSPRIQLSGQRPLDMLRQGDVAKVLEHTKIHAAENTW